MRGLVVVLLLSVCAGAFAVSANTRSHLRSALSARMELWAVNTGSCVDTCGGKSLDGSCWCDPGCAQPDFQDCCSDYLEACNNPPAFPPEFKAEWNVDPEEQSDDGLDGNDAAGAKQEGDNIVVSDGQGKKLRYELLSPEEYFAEKQEEWEHVFKQMASGECGGYGYDGYGYGGNDYGYGYGGECQLTRKVTCEGHCGKFLYYCGCDDLCVYFKDCCTEFVSFCPNEADSGLDKYLSHDHEAPSVLLQVEHKVTSLRQLHREEAMQRRYQE